MCPVVFNVAAARRRRRLHFFLPAPWSRFRPGPGCAKMLRPITTRHCRPARQPSDNVDRRPTALIHPQAPASPALRFIKIDRESAEPRPRKSHLPLRRCYPVGTRPFSACHPLSASTCLFPEHGAHSTGASRTAGRRWIRASGESGGYRSGRVRYEYIRSAASDACSKLLLFPIYGQVLVSRHSSICFRILVFPQSLPDIDVS
jgi:hypothetical protein